MKKEILRGVRPPGWDLLTDAAREAVLVELVDLPEDVGLHAVREIAPACARANEVIDALGRASRRSAVTDNDRALIESWQSLGHAGSIAAFLDLATVADGIAESALHVMTSADSDLIGGPCLECKERIVVGEPYERVSSVSSQARGRVGAVHRECMALRLIGHDYGICSCTDYGGIVGTRAQARELARRIAEEQRGRRGGMS